MEALILKQRFEGLVEKYSAEDSQITFLESLFGAKEELTKDRLLIDVAGILNETEFDPHLVVENDFSEDISLARKLCNTIFVCCREEDCDPDNVLYEIKAVLDEAKEIKTAEEDPEDLADEEEEDLDG